MKRKGRCHAQGFILRRLASTVERRGDGLAHLERLRTIGLVQPDVEPRAAIWRGLREVEEERSLDHGTGEKRLPCSIFEPLDHQREENGHAHLLGLDDPVAARRARAF